MTKVVRYEDLSARISAHFRRGVRTNAFFTREEWEEMIRQGALSAAETDAGLLLLVERTGVSRLYFYLNDLAEPLGAELPVPTVTEVAFRPRDAGLQEAAAYLEGQGIRPVLRRLRMSRPAGEIEAGTSRPLPLDTGRTDEGLVFLETYFSRLTGCLPDRRELEADLEAGNCLALEDGRGIAGLIHFSRDRRGGTIRHLAVREDRRGEGLSAPLIAGFLQATQGAPATVWTGMDSLAAQRAYGRFGFRPDGWESAVLSNI